MTTDYLNQSAKISRHYEQLAAWRRGELFAPVCVEVDLSNRCNLGCSYCAFRYLHTRGYHVGTAKKEYAETGDLMDVRLLARVLREMKDFGVKAITFSGGGEPTLHPNFSECINLAADLGFDVGVYTNGTLIDEEKAAVIKARCQWVMVSLDEDTREHFQRTKKADLFEQACDGIRRLKAAEGKATLGVGFCVGWQAGNWFDGMRILATSLGADYIQLRPRIIFDEHDPTQAAEDTSWVKRALPILKLEEQWARNATPLDARLSKFTEYADWKREYDVCYGILFTGVVTPNGRVWKCTNRRGHPDALIGDLNQESFRNVWAKKKPETNFENCRVQCCGYEMSLELWRRAQPMPHENFL